MRRSKNPQESEAQRRGCCPVKRKEWRRLEDEFAKFAGTEAALFFGSGYAANIGLLSSLVGHG